jgi:hypothetical protein
MTGVSARIVLLCALVLSIPAIRGAMHGSMSIDVALERGLVALVVSWVGVALVTAVWRHNERHPRPHRYPPSPTETGEKSR